MTINRYVSLISKIVEPTAWKSLMAELESKLNKFRLRGKEGLYRISCKKLAVTIRERVSPERERVMPGPVYYLVLGGLAGRRDVHLLLEVQTTAKRIFILGELGLHEDPLTKWTGLLREYISMFGEDVYMWAKLQKALIVFTDVIESESPRTIYLTVRLIKKVLELDVEDAKKLVRQATVEPVKAEKFRGTPPNPLRKVKMYVAGYVVERYGYRLIHGKEVKGECPLILQR